MESTYLPTSIPYILRASVAPSVPSDAILPVRRHPGAEPGGGWAAARAWLCEPSRGGPEGVPAPIDARWLRTLPRDLSIDTSPFDYAEKMRNGKLREKIKNGRHK